ncbi:CD99 antigen-like protein 2 isoform X6 [Megalobrama amblycephala]|uniref:CD99 antigen-like protein 2 isoform X6 n=1 Tax=Megalobrama amblycephala TaxID=75352 RepID=UPI002013E413|nr:CD99 antigen-like protein 2 isoform X6 [Megalobrama amblycephala]
MGKKLSTWTLLAVFSLLIVKGISQDLNLADAFDADLPSTPPPKVDPAGGTGGAVKPTPKPVKPTVKEPAKPKQTGVEDFDLKDALDPNNDIKGHGKDSGKGGSQFTDDDLVDLGNDNSYKPDKGKGGKGASSGGDLDPADDSNYDTMAETGTIAGIVSAVGMALVGAVSGYISYQKKKLCFSIQQSLNADMVKADAPDAVVAQEPQVQQTLLQPPNAEPPTEENAV